MKVEVYLAKAGLTIKPEAIKKVLIANGVEEREWERVVKDAVDAYIDYRNNGYRIRFLELLSDFCYNLKKNKPNNYTPIPFKQTKEMPQNLSKKIKEDNAIVYDKENNKIYTKGSIKESALYVFSGNELRKIKDKVSLPEIIEFVMSLIR